mgnify:CR=1 FL=1
MARLLLWLWRYVVVGQPARPGCLRHPDLPAWSICGTGLCRDCCEARCGCLFPLVKQTKEAQ